MSTLRVINGKAYVESIYGLTSAPQRRRLCWALDVDASRIVDGQIAGKRGGGVYSFVSQTGLCGEARLAGGVRAQADIDETVDVPCPKVRKGVETKWDGTIGDLGAWVKLTAKGWVRI